MAVYWHTYCSHYDLLKTHFLTINTAYKIDTELTILVSGIRHCHLCLLSHHPGQSPDHNHLSSDHPHLLSGVKSHYKNTHLSVTLCPVYCSRLWTVPDSWSFTSLAIPQRSANDAIVLYQRSPTILQERHFIRSQLRTIETNFVLILTCLCLFRSVHFHPILRLHPT